MLVLLYTLFIEYLELALAVLQSFLWSGYLLV